MSILLSLNRQEEDLSTAGSARRFSSEDDRTIDELLYEMHDKSVLYCISLQDALTRTGVAGRNSAAPSTAIPFETPLSFSVFKRLSAMILGDWKVRKW
jgi:hypothetical protein